MPRIDYAIRSIEVGRRLLGKHEGYFPLKHVGIMFTEGGQARGYHVQKNPKFLVAGTVDIVPCTYAEFSNCMGVKSIISKEISHEEVNAVIARLTDCKDKLYVMGVYDCERVASIAFGNWTRFGFHRQFWVALALAILISSAAEQYHLVTTKNAQLTLLDISLYNLGLVACGLFLVYFFFFLNNTTKRSPTDDTKPPWV